MLHSAVQCRIFKSMPEKEARPVSLDDAELQKKHVAI